MAFLLIVFIKDDEYELLVNCTSKIIVVNLQCGVSFNVVCTVSRKSILHTFDIELLSPQNDTKLKKITTGQQRHLMFVRVTTRVCDFSR